MFDPTDPTPERFRGYGPSELPNSRDEEVAELVDDLIAGGPQAVATVLSTITERGRRVMGAYAERMASLAVRRQDRTTLLRAVVANVVGGLDQNRRESIMVMAPIEDAAKRIGVDLPGLFEEASETVGSPGTVYLVQWLGRKPENRTLTCMKFVVTEDDDGFRYTLEW